MTKIGLISDTHCFFDDKLKNFFEPVETIWHAGDFGNLETLDTISKFKPMKGVYGNCDDYMIRLSVPEVQLFTVEEVKIVMMHIGGYPGRYTTQAMQYILAEKPDLFVCGHSHILKIIYDKKNNLLALNPGAAGVQGFHNVRSALRFKIEGKKITDMEIGEWERKY
jgi:uncharacterized protein